MRPKPGEDGGRKRAKRTKSAFPVDEEGFDVRESSKIEVWDEKNIRTWRPGPHLANHGSVLDPHVRSSSPDRTVLEPTDGIDVLES